MLNNLIRNSFLMKNKNTNRKKNQFKRSGFTLVELIVVMVVLSILMTLSVMGILAWQDWSRFKQQNEYAQNIFVAAQNQLNEYSANGKLNELYDYMIDEDSDSINLGFELTENRLKQIVVDESLHKYDPDALWPESVSNGKTDKKRYQNKIISVRVDKYVYSRYQKNPLSLKNSTVDSDRQAYVLFELIGSYIYDPSLLEKGSICIEFTPRDGQVFAVFYSDYVDTLNYNKISDSIKGDWADEAVSEGIKAGSLIDRSETYRKNNMIGFYSVDTLYASTKNQIIQPKLTKVMLHNEETFYLTYEVSNSNDITQYLNYDIELFESKSKQARLKLTLDGTKIRNEENQGSIPCTVLRNVARKDSYGNVIKDANGNIMYEEEGTEIGTFPILAYIDKDKTVHVIFDAADVQAQTYLYKSELSKIYGTSAYADTTNFARTYSFFRFGIDPTDYYVSMKGYGTGFKDSILKRSNIKNSTFETISNTTSDGKTSYVYKIKNPRHLNNVRFIEDLAYEQQAQISSGVAAIDKVSFELVSDLNITKFQEDGYYYNTYSRVGDINLSTLNNKIVDKDDTDATISNITNLNCEFPSFTRLRARDVFDGKENDIIGYRSSEISNVLYGVYSTDITNPSVLSELKPVGLFNINYGEIKDLTLDDLSFTGAKYIGGFSGINAGTLTKLKTNNTNKISRVIGLSDVGGIMGFQLPVSTTVEIKELENRATVEGVKAVGGILGMVRNEYSNLSFASLPGITSIVSEETLKTRETKITIKDCSNYGIIRGSNKSDIKGVYNSDSEKNDAKNPINNATIDPRFENDDPDDIEARYIGGIVGYCYNKYEDETKTGLVKIESCLSSPQMDDASLNSILQNNTTLKNKLKGVYIGGIAGYNHFCEINNCSTSAEKGKDGYLFGYRYVGGIVGMNIGPASGIKGADPGKQGTNENHVIAYDFAGGITGCNANVVDKDSFGNDISASDQKDPEKLLGLLIPDSERSLHVKIENWLNKGFVIATNSYSGGITGYNAGWIYGCNSSVEPDIADKYFATIYSGDYTGGISGYNNGIIGNTQRKVINSHDSRYETPGNTFSTVCYVKGHNYVGGIVGYNDVDSIVEDYEVASGYVYGDDQSCFVGGYAGLNASLDLLMDQTRTTARLIHSNPNRVEGTYCVGGNIGGNIINTNDHIAIPSQSPIPSESPSPSPSPSLSPSITPSEAPSTLPSVKPSTTPIPSVAVDNDAWKIIVNDGHENIEKVYAIISIDDGITAQSTSGHFSINVYNNSGQEIVGWYVPAAVEGKSFTVDGTNNINFDNENAIFYTKFDWNATITGFVNGNGYLHSDKAGDVLALKEYFANRKLPVKYYIKAENEIGKYAGEAENKDDISVTINQNNEGDKAKKFTFKIKNNSKIVMPNWRIEIDMPEGASKGWVTLGNDVVKDNIYSTYTNGSNSSIDPGASRTIDMVVYFKDKNNRDQFDINQNYRVLFNNVIYSGVSKADNDLLGADLFPMLYADGDADKNKATNALEGIESSDVSKVYGTFTGFKTISQSNKKYQVSCTLTLNNTTSNDICGWKMDLSDLSQLQNIDSSTGLLIKTEHLTYASSDKVLSWLTEDSTIIKAGNKKTFTVSLVGNSKADVQNMINSLNNQKRAVSYFSTNENVVGVYNGVNPTNTDCSFTISETEFINNARSILTIDMVNNRREALPNWRIDIDIPEGVKIKSVSASSALLPFSERRTQITEGKISIFPSNTEDAVLGGTSEGIQNHKRTTLIINFASTKDESLFKQSFSEIKCNLTFNNVIYYGNSMDDAINNVDPNPSASPLPSEVPSETPTEEPPVIEPEILDIYTYFKTDNFLGVLEGSEFVGGFVGYNLLFDEPDTAAWIASNENKDFGGVYILQKKLIDSFKATNESVLDAQQKLIKDKEIVDDLDKAFNITLNPSKARIYVSGKDLESHTTTTFGSVTGNIYVGGVLGYNDEHTSLYVKNVENATPVIAKTAIPYDSEQILNTLEDGTVIYRKVDYKGADKDYLYSYTGGIIGKVTRNIIIDNCWNAPTGDVQTVGTYTGGLCEINDGQIINCDVSNFGSSVIEYIGGLCGLNKYIIKDCNFNRKTVSGKNVVGGITAENFGVISNIHFTQPKMIIEGTTDTSHDGVCGLFAAVNGSLGTIEIGDNLSNISIVSKGSYVGAVTGYNQGTIQVCNNKEYHENSSTKGNVDQNIELTGTITGYKSVGGFIGCNDNLNTNQIVYLTNDAKVTATHGDAGGIVGINKSGEPIRYCVNNRVVSATEEGDAGGITATNNSIIEYCYDYSSVNAPNGITGGITAFNDIDGSITDCFVGSQGTKNIEFISSTIVGGVAAKNNGFIADNTLSMITVTNYKTATKTEIGTVVGRNMSDGEILVGAENAITDCKAIVETNECKVGGIAGSNEGYIHGTLADNGSIASIVNCDITLDLANYASIGGIAGHNTGVIENLAVDASIEGNLGSDTTGYGGIVGYSGYRTLAALEKAQQKLGKSSKAATKSNRTAPNMELEYPARIENCTFDGTLHAIGSSGQPARIGGIAGYNMYGSKISASCIGTRATDINGNVATETLIYAGKIDGGHDLSNADFSSYAYLSGCTGENYGCILACENSLYSTDTVTIFGYGGETAGIAANNYGFISGYKESDDTIHYLSTGKKWSIEQRFADNDHGPGGIVGIYKSTQDVSYIQNYASVTSKYKTNNKTGGIFASLEQYEIPKIKLSYVDNYGDIYGFCRTGGFIAQVRSKGADFEYCKNFGNVYSETKNVGGFVGRFVDYTSSSTFLHCENHGKVANAVGINEAVGGFVGSFTNENLDNNLTTFFYDCVNTGIIKRDGDASDSKVGNFVGEASGKLYLDYCRNYNTSNSNSSANGFVRSDDNAVLSNCFNNGTRMFTDYSKTTGGLPFKGAGIIYNGYYLSPANDIEIDTTDYGVLADIGGMSNFLMTYNGMDVKDMPDTTVYLAPPSDSNYISFNDKSPKVKISLGYDEDSKGIDGIVFYLANNVTDKNATNTNLTYSATPTYYFSDGTSATGTKVVVTSNRDYRSGEMVLKNPSSNKKPEYVVVSFDNNGSNIYYRGMAYIPAANTSKKAAFSRYLIDQEAATYTISKVYRPHQNGKDEQETLNINVGGIPSSAMFYKNRNSDVLKYEFGPYENLSMNVKYGAPVHVFIDGNYTENAKGMKTFIFYLSPEKTGANNQVNVSDQYNYYYDYTVEFTDIDGKVYKTNKYVDKVGYFGGDDLDLSKSEQRIEIPDFLNPKIATIHIEIQYKKRTRMVNNALEVTDKQSEDNPNKYIENGKVFLRGFKYVAEGETEPKLMTPGRTGANAKFDLQTTNTRYTRLSVSHTEQKTSVYSQTNASAFSFNLTYPENNPVGKTYYNDLSDYKDSLTASKKSGSRIDVFYDLDPKLRVKMHALNAWYIKLQKPTNLKYVEKNGGYRLTWDKSFKADSYELYYEIRKPDGSKVITSDVLTLGSQMTSYDVPIEKAWKVNNYHIQFYVKAINGYHYAFSDSKAADFDPHYDKYDSDWASSVEIAIEKQALPTPKIHWEIVNGNRTTFVLDNYDEYEALGCTDCTIYFTYIDQTFEWNLSQEKYRKPEKITMGTKGGNSFFYKAVPNAGISNYFVESNTYRNLTEAHGNDKLADSSEYATTTFKGFYGTSPEEMRYEIQFKVPKSGLDTYQRTDISAYDKSVGATVVYNNEITHTANSTGTQDFYMTSVLKNIPIEWFDSENEVDAITVRAYPYHSQFDMVHYGHEVEIDEKYLPLKLDGNLEENEAILASIIDHKYFAADADTVSDRNVYNTEMHDMNPGYLLMKQLDGTYEIFYSSVIDMSMDAAGALRGENAVKPYRIYSNYDVAYKIYQNPYTETKNSVTPVKISQSDFQEMFWIRNKDNTTNAEVGTITSAKNLEIQTAPIFESIVPGTEDNIKTYTVLWDKYFFDPKNYDTANNRYSTAATNTAFGKKYADYFETWKNFSERVKYARYGSNANTYATFSNENRRKLNNAYLTSYSNANYIATLYGRTFDGEEVQLESLNISGNAGADKNGRINLGVLEGMLKYDDKTTTDLDIYAYQAVFKDTNNEWSNYPYIFVRVTRLGQKDTYGYYGFNNSLPVTDTNGSVMMLPRYAQMGYDVQLKLNTISKPNVILRNEDGHFVTSSLEYTVKWGAITDQMQKDDLGGYLITVKPTDENAGENHTKPHYYYVNENQIHLVETDYADGVLSEISAENYQIDGDNRIAYIDLSDFNTDEIVSISVKAIAKESPTYFGDGDDGVENEITIPDRLVVPDVSLIQLIADQAADGGMRDYDSASCTKISTHVDPTTGEKDSDETLSNTVDMTEYSKGISLSYNKEDPNYQNQPTAKVRLAVAVFDQIDAYGKNDKTNHDFGDYENVKTNQWNKGAYKTLYSKENSLDLGYVSSENVSNINLITDKFEEYPGEFAGKWLKIVAKAESSTRIDSQWSDQDLEEAETINACWIQLPNVLLDDVSLKASDCAQSDPVIDPVQMYQTKNGIVDKMPASGTYTTLDIQTLEMNIDPNAEAYTITSLGKMRITDDYAYTPVYQIMLQKSYDTTGIYDHSWDVYLKALGEYTTLKNAERIAQEKGYETGAKITLEDGRDKIIPECVIDNEAVYVGNISESVSSLALNDLYAMLGAKEDIMLYAKLEMIADQEKNEMFRLILPDILAIDGKDTTRLKDSYIGVKRILIQMMLSEEASKAHICGHNAIYRNVAILQDDGKTNIWKKELQIIDQKDYDAFFEDLETYFEQEKQENEKPSENDSVSANSL